MRRSPRMLRWENVFVIKHLMFTSLLMGNEERSFFIASGVQTVNVGILNNCIVWRLNNERSQWFVVNTFSYAIYPPLAHKQSGATRRESDQLNYDFPTVVRREMWRYSSSRLAYPTIWRFVWFFNAYLIRSAHQTIAMFVIEAPMKEENTARIFDARSNEGRE